MFIEAASMGGALRRYALALGFEADEIRDELLREIHDEDFLCNATIEINDLIEPGTDLDGTMTGAFDPETQLGVTAWIVGRSGIPEQFIDSLPTDGTVLQIWYGSKPGEACFAPRWDDDAFGLLFEPAVR